VGNVLGFSEEDGEVVAVLVRGDEVPEAVVFEVGDDARDGAFSEVVLPGRREIAVALVEVDGDGAFLVRDEDVAEGVVVDVV
jgi:hypothetical protein